MYAFFSSRAAAANKWSTENTYSYRNRLPSSNSSYAISFISLLGKDIPTTNVKEYEKESEHDVRGEGLKRDRKSIAQIQTTCEWFRMGDVRYTGLIFLPAENFVYQICVSAAKAAAAVAGRHVCYNILMDSFIGYYILPTLSEGGGFASFLQ